METAEKDLASVRARHETAAKEVQAALNQLAEGKALLQSWINEAQPKSVYEKKRNILLPSRHLGFMDRQWQNDLPVFGSLRFPWRSGQLTEVQS